MNHDDDMEASPLWLTIVIQDGDLEVFGAICLVVEQEVLLAKLLHGLVVVQLILRRGPSLLLNSLVAELLTSSVLQIPPELVLNLLIFDVDEDSLVLLVALEISMFVEIQNLLLLHLDWVLYEIARAGLPGLLSSFAAIAKHWVVESR